MDFMSGDVSFPYGGMCGFRSFIISLTRLRQAYILQPYGMEVCFELCL